VPQHWWAGLEPDLRRHKSGPEALVVLAMELAKQDVRD
jgi:hypothetical protein